MAGRQFGEWKVGDTIAHDVRHTVTADGNRVFTLMTHNPQPLHLDADYAAKPPNSARSSSTAFSPSR